MRLYHYTSVEHLPLIFADGFIKTVESNVSPTVAHAGPDVVWLTTNPDPADGSMGLDGASVDKYVIRITVDVDRRSVHRWHDWAKRHNVASDWMKALAAVGGAGSWRVVERPIPSSRWLHIGNRRTGETITIPERNAA